MGLDGVTHGHWTMNNDQFISLKHFNHNAYACLEAYNNCPCHSLYKGTLNTYMYI